MCQLRDSVSSRALIIAQGWRRGEEHRRPRGAAQEATLLCSPGPGRQVSPGLGCSGEHARPREAHTDARLTEIILLTSVKSRPPPETPVCVPTRAVQKEAEMPSATYPQGSEASSSPNARDPILSKRKRRGGMLFLPEHPSFSFSQALSCCVRKEAELLMLRTPGTSSPILRTLETSSLTLRMPGTSSPTLRMLGTSSPILRMPGHLL